MNLTHVGSINCKSVYFVLLFLKTVIAGRNLAVGKTTYQTDTSHDAPPSKAVDGVTNGNFHAGSCTHTASYEVSWEVDLGSIYSIDNVTIFNRLDCCSERLHDVLLYIGLTRTSYQQRGFHAGAVGVSHVFEIADYVNGRWVKITRSVADSALTLCEVQVIVKNIFKSRCFRDSSQQVSTGTVLKSGSAESPLLCCHMCMELRCLGAVYNDETKSCDVYGTISEYAASSGGSVLLIAQYD